MIIIENEFEKHINDTGECNIDLFQLQYLKSVIQKRLWTYYFAGIITGFAISIGIAYAVI